MDITFNKSGIPLIAVGKHFYSTTTGAPKNSAKKNKNNEKNILEDVDDVFSFNEIKYASWGSNNRYPDDADAIIRKTGVLSTGIDYKCRCCYGQGVFPVTVEGFDEQNNEIFKAVGDKEINKFLRGYVFRNFHTDAFRDLNKFGNCFPIFKFNMEGTKILSPQILNARHCRLSTDKKKLLVFGDFANSSPGLDNSIVYDVLDEHDPAYDLQWRKDHKKLSGQSIAFPRIARYMSNNDYYATPDWDTAYQAGWIDVAHKIPAMLKKIYTNAMSLMWHVQIPYSYWEARYKKTDYKSEEARQDAIKAEMDEIDKNLASEENANKTIFTHYSTNENRVEEKWIIDKLDNKLNIDEKLSTSAAANSEILFSMMVNPSVIGAGTPGGPYAGNAGSGSDIREGLLLSMILSYIEKQQVLDPVELMFQFNGIEDIEIKYKQITLLTLDKGKSTEEKLS